MKKLYLIHGWGGRAEGGWFDFLKKELKQKEWIVEAFDMPDTNHPRIEEWVKHLEKKVKKIDEETYFLGHSIGCQTIMRFLEKLPKHQKIGGVIFIAGWFNLKNDSYESQEEIKIAEPWINFEIDYERVTRPTLNFLAIFSEDDPFVPKEDIDLFKKRLNAKTILLNNKGHFDTLEEFEEAYPHIERWLKLK